MTEPLESDYDWQGPVALSVVVLLAGIGLLAYARPVGWISAALVLTGCWVAYGFVVYRRTRAYLRVDGPTLTVRSFRAFHEISGPDLVKVSQLLTRRGPSYRLTVRAADGRLVRYGAPTARLRRGHSTLFGWILTWAPQAELDHGSRRTLQILRERGALPESRTEPERPEPDPKSDDRA